MKLSHALITLPAIAFASVTLAEPTLYGKANVSLQMADEGDDGSTSELVSNASRLGVKGKAELENGLQAIYKFEYETSVDDGSKDGQTFTQRNIYVGVKGDFGQVIAGKFDTPFKTAQNKIDQFNDLEGDIKNVITENDNRTNNTVQYSTPESMGPFGASFAYVASEDPDVSDGKSLSVSYDNNGIYAAIAFDQDVEDEGAQAQRGVVQWKVDQFQVGALLESSEDAAGQSSEAWLLSGAYKIEKITLKAQVGQSDIVFQDGQVINVGADFAMAKQVKTFVYYTANEGQDDTGAEVEENYLGAGIEVKF